MPRLARRRCPPARDRVRRGPSYSRGVTLAAIEGPDLLIVLVILLVLFGGAKIPQLARSLGEAKREFEQGHTDPTVPDDAAGTSSS